MQPFKKIIIFLICSILFYTSMYVDVIGQARSTVQVTIVPNQYTLSEVNKLFNDTDDKHLEPYLNNPPFQIGTNNDTRSGEF